MLPPLTVTVRLHPTQRAFCRSDALIRGYVGGRGAGKSWAGAYDLLCRAMARPRSLYMVLAPTYTELQDSSWRTLLTLARELHCRRDDNKSDLRLLLGNGAEVLGRSGDRPDRLRGPNLSGLWIDEGSQIHEEAYLIALACLREGGCMGWLSSTFTPRGKQHWTYQTFATGKPHTALFRCPTSANPFLPPEFLPALQGQYTSRTAAQELEGEFTDPAGQAFDPSWLTRRARVAPAGAGVLRVRYWDKAGTPGAGAYTAGVLLSRSPDGLITVEDVIRGQWSALQRERVILATAQRDGHAVEVWVEQEPGSGGKESAEATLRALAGFRVHAERATGDKAVRAEPFAAQCEAGNVALLTAPWNAAYVDELVSFPGGKYADQVDASSGAFNKLAAKVLGGRAFAGTPEQRVAAARAPEGVFLT